MFGWLFNIFKKSEYEKMLIEEVIWCRNKRREYLQKIEDVIEEKRLFSKVTGGEG